jgi:hypothetical protein
MLERARFEPSNGRGVHVVVSRDIGLCFALGKALECFLPLVRRENAHHGPLHGFCPHLYGHE